MKITKEDLYTIEDMLYEARGSIDNMQTMDVKYREDRLREAEHALALFYRMQNAIEAEEVIEVGD